MDEDQELFPPVRVHDVDSEYWEDWMAARRRKPKKKERRH